jgi:hypothetical protein
LEQCKSIKPEQIVEFLENFKLLHSRGRTQVDQKQSPPEPPFGKSVLISLKVPEKILSAFKLRAQLEEVPYQTQIKKLMLEWLRNRSTSAEDK